MATGGAFNNGPTGTTSDSEGGVFNNVNSNVTAAAAGGSGTSAEVLALIAAETAARILNDNLEIGIRAADDTTEMTDRVAADANLDAIKQDTLIAGANITLTDNGNDTTTIASAGGGGTAPIVTVYTLRLDFLFGADQPTVVVNTGMVVPTVDFVADSISDSEIPVTSDVNVNGIPFILNTDYIISSGVLQFTDYDLVPQDGDVIIVSATIVS